MHARRNRIFELRALRSVQAVLAIALIAVLPGCALSSDEVEEERAIASDEMAASCKVQLRDHAFWGQHPTTQPGGKPPDVAGPGDYFGLLFYKHGFEASFVDSDGHGGEWLHGTYEIDTTSCTCTQQKLILRFDNGMKRRYLVSYEGEYMTLKNAKTGRTMRYVENDHWT